MITATTTCSFNNPEWILKDGEIRTLEPLETAEENANFQFASSTCYTRYESITGISVENGFSHGEIVLSFFAFFTFITLAYAVIFYALRGIKIKQ